MLNPNEEFPTIKHIETNYIILRAAQRQYYQDLLTEHKSSLKKSYQVIKIIINKRKCNPTYSNAMDMLLKMGK